MIYIVQALCPQRHCIMAVAYDDAEYTEQEATRKLAFAMARARIRLEIDPWCGLCKSPELHFEVGPTGFATLEDARPHLLAAEEAQRRTREEYFNRRN